MAVNNNSSEKFYGFTRIPNSPILSELRRSDHQSHMIYTYLCAKANYGQSDHLDIGEVEASIPEIMRVHNYTKWAVESRLKKLISLRLIKNNSGKKTGKKTSKYFVCHYAKNQETPGKRTGKKTGNALPLVAKKERIKKTYKKAPTKAEGGGGPLDFLEEGERVQESAGRLLLRQYAQKHDYSLGELLETYATVKEMKNEIFRSKTVYLEGVWKRIDESGSEVTSRNYAQDVIDEVNSHHEVEARRADSLEFIRRVEEFEMNQIDSIQADEVVVPDKQTGGFIPKRSEAADDFWNSRPKGQS